MILDGIKKYELRVADFEVKEGDVLVLREWDSLKKDYTGRVLEREIKAVLKTKDLDFFPKEDVEKFGYQIISFN